jgi:cytochrome P450
MDPAIETESRLPPGPRSHHLRQSLAWFNRPVRFMERGRERYGPIFAARFGPEQRAVFVSDPDAIREIVRGDPAVLRMGDANGLFRPVVGSSSILVLDGDEHRRHRRLMMPAFRRNHVAEFERVIAGAVERRAAEWPLAGRFPVQPEMEGIAFETIAEMALGSSQGPRVERLRRLFGRMMDLCESPFTLLPYFRRELGGLSPYGRLKRALAELDELVFAEIDERRRRGDSEERDDLLSLLVRAHGADGTPMTDREIRDELVTMLMAGQETTTSALSWSFERLARHPDVADRLVAEIERGDDTYLDAVVKEVLRQRPPIPVMVRKLRAPVEVGGYDCPAGWVLMPSIYLVHREPSVYPDPERFHPERFLTDPPPAHAWIPFGGGDRRCLGANLAEFEMRVVLRTVLPMLKLATSEAADEPIRRQRFAFSPRHGASVAFASRREPVVPRQAPLPARFPPGPRTPALVQTLAIAHDPVAFLDRCRDRHGDAVTINLLGFGRTVWVTDPPLVKRVLASPDEMSGGEANRVTEPIIGPHSIVNSEGPVHKERRRRISPALRTGHVERYAAGFAAAAEREIETWEPGELALHPAIARISMEVILRAVLGVRPRARREQIGIAVAELAAMGNLAALNRVFRADVGPASPGGRFRRRRERLDQLLYAEIARAREPGEAGREDILSILARTRRDDGSSLPAEEIRDELVGLIVAGQESTGAALAWAFDLLLRHPAAHARVIAEAQVGASSFTDAAIQESLRLRPPILAAGRIALETVELGPWRLPPGTRLWAPMTLVQRDEETHPDPDRFRPERFIGRKPMPMTWIPFGGGSRRCIGMSFALLEMRAVLQTVLSRAFLRTVGESERPRLNNAVMAPARGMIVHFDGLRAPTDDRWAERVAGVGDERLAGRASVRSRRLPASGGRARSVAN